MGKVSLFVDGGYFFKQGSHAALGEKLGRHELLFDAKQFIAEVSEWLSATYPGDELLRTYWYDGARQGVPTLEQLEIAALSFVKLRLGRLNASGQQKGVDTLIVRDLMVLSQERSIHRAIVLSGDEDLREGVVYAQDRGVRVAVVGIEVHGHRSQSAELVRDSDESLVLPADLLSHSLKRRPSQVVVLPPPSGPVGTDQPTSLSHAGKCIAEALGVATEYLAQATGPEIAALLERYPEVPRELDALMLNRGARSAGVYPLSQVERRAMRAAFWNTIKPPQAGE